MVSSCSDSGILQPGAGGVEGGDAGNDVDVGAGIELAQHSGQVAKAGIGGGIALDEKQHVLPGCQQRLHRFSGLEPVAGEFFDIVRHGKQQRLVRSGQRQPGPQGDVQRIAFLAQAAHRVGPDRIGALQQGPGPAGDKAGVAGTQRNAEQAARSYRRKSTMKVSHQFFRFGGVFAR